MEPLARPHAVDASKDEQAPVLRWVGGVHRLLTQPGSPRESEVLWPLGSLLHAAQEGRNPVGSTPGHLGKLHG
eukprot:7060881-Alexandrium_andersonii.AAC.1